MQPQHLSSKQTVFLTQLLSEHTIEIVTSSFIKEWHTHKYTDTLIHSTYIDNIAHHTTITLFLSFTISNTWDMWLKNKQFLWQRFKEEKMKSSLLDWTNQTLANCLLQANNFIWSSYYINANFFFLKKMKIECLLYT